MTRRTLVATALLAAFCIAPAFADVPIGGSSSSHHSLHPVPSLRMINKSACDITIDLLRNGHERQGYATIAPFRDWEWTVEGEFKIEVTGKCGSPTAPMPAEVTATLRSGDFRTYTVDVDTKDGKGAEIVIHHL